VIVASFTLPVKTTLGRDIKPNIEAQGHECPEGCRRRRGSQWIRNLVKNL
jgi:hypothetical protein